jgi:hypothetical protein
MQSVAACAATPAALIPPIRMMVNAAGDFTHIDIKSRCAEFQRYKIKRPGITPGLFLR